ncbi:MAG: hypothetical protein AB7P40_14500 [Chloroflexota bacterium]
MMTTCPELGRLRTWLDRDALAADPADAASPTPLTSLTATDALAEHLAACETCQDALTCLDEDAKLAATALNLVVGPPPSPAETERALQRVRGQLAAGAAPVAAVPTPIRPELAPVVAPPARTAAISPVRAAARPAAAEPADDWRRVPPPTSQSAGSGVSFWRRWRLTAAGVAAAVALTLTVATPQGQAAASGFLSQFRSQRLAVVSFNSLESRQSNLARIEQLGTLQNSRQPRPAEVGSIQEAASKAGFPVLQPDPATLPAGVASAPKVRYAPATETRLTFDEQKARAYFDSINRKDLSLPARLDKSTLVVTMPPMVMLEYGRSENRPGLMIGQARELQVRVEGGASLEEVRAFLLGLPGLPQDLVKQLGAIQDWTNTLPIPVPVDKVSWQETNIAGAPAFILNDNTGLGSGVIWQRDGRILGVAGSLKATEIRKIAESLR